MENVTKFMDRVKSPYRAELQHFADRMVVRIYDALDRLSHPELPAELTFDLGGYRQFARYFWGGIEVNDAWLSNSAGLTISDFDGGVEVRTASGLLHGSPARIWNSGLKEDYRYGLRHAEGKPAVYGDPINADEYWVNGTKIDAATYKLVSKWGEYLYIDGKIALSRSFVPMESGPLQFTAEEIGLMPPSTEFYQAIQLTNLIDRRLKEARGDHIPLWYSKKSAINVIKSKTNKELNQIIIELQHSKSNATMDWLLSFAPAPTEVPAPVDFGAPGPDSLLTPTTHLSTTGRAWPEAAAKSLDNGEITFITDQEVVATPPAIDDNSGISMGTALALMAGVALMTPKTKKVKRNAAQTVKA